MSSEMTFEERTRHLLINRPRTLQYVHITASTGLTVPWLSLFAAGADHDFGVRKVQKLHDFLLAHVAQVVA